MLILSRSDFLHELSTKATGPKVKAAALAAIGATAEEQTTFLQTGSGNCSKRTSPTHRTGRDHQRRREDPSPGDGGQGPRRRQGARRGHRRRHPVAQRRQLPAFHPPRGGRRLGDRGQRRSYAALASPDPAVWKAFIDTGIYEASQRDQAREEKAQADSDRALIQEILTAAEADGRKNLSLAAKAALAGTPVDYDNFMRVDRHNVPVDLPDTIVDDANGDCLGVKSESKAAAAETWMDTCSATLTSQAWEIIPQASQKAQIRNALSGLCLAPKGASKSTAVLVQVACSSTKLEQSWYIQKDNSGLAQIQNNNSALCLTGVPGTVATTPGGTPSHTPTQEACRETTSIFQGNQMMRVHSRGLVNLTAGEFTGDSNDDLLAVQVRDGKMWLYPGTTAGGTFGTRKAVAGNWSGLNNLVSGEFNRDAFTDVIAIQAATGKVLLYPGTGPGKFGAKVELAASGWNVMSQLTVGRFNRDEYDDLIALHTATGSMRLYPGTAAGGKFGTWAEIDGTANGMVDFTGGDFNNDGRADMIAVNLSDGALRLHPGRIAGGAFGGWSALVASGWTGYHELTSGKFNRDAFDDVITFDQATSKLWLYVAAPPGSEPNGSRSASAADPVRPRTGPVSASGGGPSFLSPVPSTGTCRPGP